MEKMKTIDVKGKAYVMVNERIKAFRNNYKGYSLISEIVELSDSHCVMKASVVDPEGKVVANGYARETVNKSPINKFAFVENAETSAWGRALGNFGIGVDVAICSAEELLVKLSAEQEPAKVELSLNEEELLRIDSCRGKEELIKVCQDIKQEHKGDKSYSKALVNAYNKKLAELK